MKKTFKVIFNILFLIILTCLLCIGIYFIRKSENTEEKIEDTKIEDTYDEWYFHNSDDEELLKKYQDYNDDVVGIIRINDSVLNHPMVQTKEEEDYYLYRDLDKKYNSHGVPLLSANSEIEKFGSNMVVYGHNINIHTRDIFADLNYYEDIEYYKTHPYIETVSKSGTRRWLIFAYFITDNSDHNPFRYSDYTNFTSKEQFDSYISEVDKRNWIDIKVPIEYGDTLITLSSCSRELAGSGTNRMVVMGKLIRTTDDYTKEINNSTGNSNPVLPEKLQ